MRIPDENKKKNGPEAILEKVIAQYLKNLQESLCESESQLVVSDYLRPHGLYSPWNLLASPWIPEYQSGQPFPSPGDLPNTGIKSRSPALQVDSLPSQQPGKFTAGPWQMPESEHVESEPVSPESPTLAGGFLPLSHLGSKPQNPLLAKTQSRKKK